MDNKKFYKLLYLCRKTDEKIIELANKKEIKNPIHLSIGQEAISVGVCSALEKNDVAFGTYRSHALYISKGGDLNAMFSELYGKETGCAGGKGGSMHLIDVNARILGTSGIVGTGIPNAVGYAYGMKLQRKNNIVLCMFGDGAVDEGVFHESLNFAALKKVNILFVCENNSYAIRSHQRDRQAICNIKEKAKIYGIPSKLIDNKVDVIYKEIKHTVEEMRINPGPRFFECYTCRWKEHLGTNDDSEMCYRPKQDVEKSINTDELTRVADLLDIKERLEIELEINTLINAAVLFAQSSKFPENNAIFENLYR